MKYCDAKCWIFRDQSSRSSWSYGLVVGGPVRSRGLDLVTLQVPCGWRCSLIPQLYSSAPVLSRGQMYFRGHWVCSEDGPGSKRDSGMLAEGTQTGKSSCARAGQHHTAKGAQAAQPQGSQRTPDPRTPCSGDTGDIEGAPTSRQSHSLPLSGRWDQTIPKTSFFNLLEPISRHCSSLEAQHWKRETLMATLWL